ncbi:uncharacterized protein LOC132553514 [Ylistrum balloti]|uniref:uncharacterized protein LOC132553513 n=1 Tax=Ylistrum balloti TaxID=509963 RepID=UPI0029059A82|nr:uncharacterized protein LOC132553513 [Ylistrum balloti]XP_060073746.1 uncharacterized protein LOC132553514 [Ylistrum balloti]
MATACDTSTLTGDSLEGDEILKQLNEKAYAVVPNVLTLDECDRYMAEFKSWHKKFDDLGVECSSRNSVIQSYRTGHFSTSWEVRLKSKPIFAKVWKTDKLLSSADAIAISKPPEQGSEEYADPDKEWLHLDQAVYRQGLHAYQAGVYLEETTDTDHCLRVMAHSHLYHADFFNTFPPAATRSRRCEFLKLSKAQKAWYDARGCKRTKVPVPKGGMVLWDSRTVHDNMKPVYGRPNKDRWRFVVFVSMTPAIWASPEAIEKKNIAYDKMLTTAHWASMGVRNFKPFTPKGVEKDLTIHAQPDIAQTREAKLLFGKAEYDFEDGKPNGPKAPVLGNMSR